MSAASVLRELDRERFEPVPIGIAKDGRWLLPADAAAALREGVARAGGRLLAFRPRPEEGSALVPLEGGGASAPPGLPRDVRLDVVFPVLHGPYGEDGTIQGLLELLDIPYVGSGVLGSAVGMDKAIQKDVLRRHGIPTADYALVLAPRFRGDPAGTVDELERRFGYPVFVKPANLGSSVGVSRAADRAELERALGEAARFDRRLIVEEAIAGRELECSVLGNDEPEASLPGEILPSRGFYDYEAKYVDESTRLAVPAELPEDVVEAVRSLAVRAFLAIDAAGLARVDFFLARDGRLLVNEVNTMPGFTRVSMYPKLWEASGLSYGDLLTRLVELALERHSERRSLRTDR